MIPAVVECCAGIDVGKKFVVACVLKGPADGEAQARTRKYGTNNCNLEELRSWLADCGCTHAVMESTGEYWRPVFNVLEQMHGLQIVLANSQQVKGLRGHKTDPDDAHWLAHLLRHGMIRRSYIPPREIRELRDLTRRRRQLVRTGAQERNRVQKVLEGANIKIGNVLSDVFGLSGQLILEAVIEGKATPEEMAQFARRSARKKIPQLQAALEGHRMTDMQRTMIRLSLDHMEFVEVQIEAIDTEIARHVEHSGLQTAHDVLQTIPGIRQEAASNLLAEFGPDMTVFGTASKCSAWAGVAPGNNQSAGQRKRAPALRGNPWVRSALVECAWSASRKKDSEFQHQYQRLKPRLGHKRAIVAVAHALTITIFHVLSAGEPYQGPGATAMPDVRTRKLINHHTRRLKALRNRLKTDTPG